MGQSVLVLAPELQRHIGDELVAHLSLGEKGVLLVIEVSSGISCTDMICLYDFAFDELLLQGNLMPLEIVCSFPIWNVLLALVCLHV